MKENIAILLLLFSASLCKAQYVDTVFFKSGSQALVEFVKESDSSIVVRNDNGRFTISKSDIERVGKFSKNLIHTSVDFEVKHYQYLGKAGKLGIAGMAIGLGGGVIALAGGLKGNRNALYAGSAIASVSVPVFVSSFTMLIKSSKRW